MVENKKVVLPDDDQCVKLYESLVKMLKRYGFKQYEISNFAKDKKFSKHNMAYWKRENYIGFGLGAHSFYGKRRKANSTDMQNYLNRKKIHTEKLSTNDQITEIIMLGLRCDVGVNLKVLLKLGYDLTKNPYYNDYLDKKILKQKGSKIYLNKNYYGVSNSIICDLLPD